MGHRSNKAGEVVRARAQACRMAVSPSSGRRSPSYATWLRPHLRRLAACVLAAVLVLALLALAGCGSTGAGSGAADGETSGPAVGQRTVVLSPFSADAAQGQDGALIDDSHVAEGYVAASGTSSARLKMEVATGGVSYYYDLPSDGTPISCPLSAGSGTYTFTIWQNTSGNRYVELFSLADQNVELQDEFQPFIRPSVYCAYDGASESTKLAAQLSADAQNEGDILRAVYNWVVGNIKYDNDKAAQLKDATGYIPDPDDTIAAKKGICFDYASLAAAMLRSQGIPCRIITGTVSPDNIYHAWNEVYIDGSWVTATIDVDQGTWTRIDPTFAAADGSSTVGDGTSYTERYTY